MSLAEQAKNPWTLHSKVSADGNGVAIEKKVISDIARF
jgi:hypothetical protein|tara:strand:+ start:665 stop:778 length:114 start_codon:yes stop_codon:yes gene_type:complete